MAQYDVYALPNAFGYVVDCQSDLLSHLTTRFVIPLTPATEPSAIHPRFNPGFLVAGADYFLDTRYATSVPRDALHEPIASLAEVDDRIFAAIDFLVRGF